MGPPDYIFGPPPGAEAPSAETPGAAVPGGGQTVPWAGDATGWGGPQVPSPGFAPDGPATSENPAFTMWRQANPQSPHLASGPPTSPDAHTFATGPPTGPDTHTISTGPPTGPEAHTFTTGPPTGPDPRTFTTGPPTEPDANTPGFPMGQPVQPGAPGFPMGVQGGVTQQFQPHEMMPNGIAAPPAPLGTPPHGTPPLGTPPFGTPPLRTPPLGAPPGTPPPGAPPLGTLPPVPRPRVPAPQRTPPSGTPPGGVIPWPPPQTAFGGGAGLPDQQTAIIGGPPPAPPRRPSRRRLIAIGAGITALAVAAGAISLVYRHSKAQHTTPRAAPSPASSATPQLRLASKIDNVKTDPKPITKAEFFPDRALSVDGRQFVRVAAVVNRTCARSARGSFARSLEAHKCQRVVRATYVDASKRFAVTAGVAALPTKTLAKRANRAKKLTHNVWFAGLDGPSGSGAQSVSKTGGYAYGVVVGRYIIFGYATYSNGHTPTGKGRQDHVVASLSRAFALLAERPITARAES